MEKIIADRYHKTGPRTFAFADAEYNEKVTAVNNVYGWLYEQGILEKVSFEFKDYSDVTFFALDSNDLLPYRKDIENSGVEGAELAAQHIFDMEYSPCRYSGAVELGCWMKTYRDWDGTVGSSWETYYCNSLSSPAVLDVAAEREKHGVKSAVSLAFELLEFERSDIVTIRALTDRDSPQVINLDETSGSEVADSLDCKNYAWGIFLGKELVGYCTLGGAEDYEEFEQWNYDALVLCDVFVLEECRGQGLATQLLDEVIAQNTQSDEKIFITILDDRLSDFYERLGFYMIDEDGGVMLRETPRKSLAEKVSSAKANLTNRENNRADSSFEIERESL